MMKKCIPHPSCFFVLLLLTASAPAVRADIFHLKNGGPLEGKVIKRADGRVHIKTTSGIVSIHDEADIVAVEKRRTARDVYNIMAEKIKPGHAEGHYALAMWCRDRDLRDEALDELVKALKIDPQHERAWQALGYVKTDKGWLTREEAMRAKGMVLVNGRWVTKEQAEKLEEQEANKRLVLAINRVVYSIRSSTKSRRKQSEENLANFDNPALAWKILSLLSHDVTGVRRAACASLAKMKHHDAVPRLVRHALMDSKESVRVAALDAMLKLDHSRALDALYEMISDLRLTRIKSRADQRAAKRLYRRIALALDAIGDVRSVPFLAEILYPKIEIEGRTVSSNMSGVGTFGIMRSSGGPLAVDITQSGTTLGIGDAESVPAEPERYYHNQAAEDALKRLTGQDLGVLRRDWMRWWRKHGIELLRKREAEKRGGKDKADKLLREAADEPR